MVPKYRVTRLCYKKPCETTKFLVFFLWFPGGRFIHVGDVDAHHNAHASALAVAGAYDHRVSFLILEVIRPLRKDLPCARVDGEVIRVDAHRLYVSASPSASLVMMASPIGSPAGAFSATVRVTGGASAKTGEGCVVTITEVLLFSATSCVWVSDGI